MSLLEPIRDIRAVGAVSLTSFKFVFMYFNQCSWRLRTCHQYVQSYNTRRVHPAVKWGGREKKKKHNLLKTPAITAAAPIGPVLTHADGLAVLKWLTDTQISPPWCVRCCTSL